MVDQMALYYYCANNIWKVGVFFTTIEMSLTLNA